MKHMKRCRLIAALLALGLLAAGLPALAAQDDEGALRQLLYSSTGCEPVGFFYGDYDRDHEFEAFAFVGQIDDEDWPPYYGDIWFVCADSARCLIEKSGYESLADAGVPGAGLFFVEESGGGSGSTSHIWLVQNSRPVSIDSEALAGFSWDGGLEFSVYPDAFDNFSDGTGHTWKRYYYYYDPQSRDLKEYGGKALSRDQLCGLSGGADILAAIEDEGYEIADMLYRENGIVNINLRQTNEYGDTVNSNRTLEISGGAVYDTGSDYDGVYLPANTPERATYPERFPPMGR